MLILAHPTFQLIVNPRPKKKKNQATYSRLLDVWPQLRLQSDMNLQKAMEMRGRAQGQSEARHWQPNTEVCAGSGKMVTAK